MHVRHGRLHRGRGRLEQSAGRCARHGLDDAERAVRQRRRRTPRNCGAGGVLQAEARRRRGPFRVGLSLSGRGTWRCGGRAAQARRCRAARRPGGQSHAGGPDAAGRIDGRACPARATGCFSAGPGRADDRSGRQLAGRAQRRRVRAFHRREQPVHLEGRAEGQTAGHLGRHDGQPRAMPSCWRARTRARWPPRSSRAGRTSSSSLPPAVRRTTKDCSLREPRKANLSRKKRT